jgi:hypothetical protein
VSSRVGWHPLVVALIVLLGGPGDRSARADENDLHGLVAEGGRLFRSGDYAAAQEKFAAAEVLAPENPLLAYNRGLAYQAAGEIEKAEEYYRKSALASDPALEARTWFNLGDLEVQKAKAKLGEDPVKIPAGERQEILDHLDRAVARFRSVLEAKPDDRDARYNIELIRLYVKDLLDRWRKADREKARKESNLVQYLEYLMGQQKMLEHGTESLQYVEGTDADTDRPVHLQELRLIQGELADEMPHLRDKVKEHVTQLTGQAASGAPGGPGGQPSPDPKLAEKMKQYEEQALRIVGATEAAMKKAVAALEAANLDQAESHQHDAWQNLFTLWKGLADFQRALARGIRLQNALVASTEPFAEASGEEKSEDEKTREKQSAGKQREQQSTVRELVTLMEHRARAQIQQIDKMPGPGPGGGKAPPGQPNPAELREAFKKALGLLPTADEAMASAASALGDRKWSAALEKERDAAKILDEIRKLFEKFQKKKNQPQDQKNQPKQDDRKQKNREKPEQKKPEEKQPQKLSPEQAQRLLQKMRENRKKREEQRRETRMARRGRVEKDW